MNRALAGLALLILIDTTGSRAAEPQVGFVIEQPHTATAPPLGAEDMQRLAAGRPPRVDASIEMCCYLKDGFITYACTQCKYFHSSAPTLQFLFKQNVEFTVAGLVVPCDSQGLRVLRGPDGAIQQAMTEKTCCFVSANDKRITVERYQAPDCKVAEDGSMVRMSWAECNNRIEVRELAPGPEPNTRTFETKQFHPEHAAGKFNLYVTELSETAARSQVLTRIYKGEQAVPEALIRQELLQRVILKEGMGYRQIIKIEKLNPAGVMVPDTHVIETWRVEPNGGRRLADRQELIKPARDEDTAEEH